MQGHVFLVHGDLTKLSCDAWLVPSGTRPKPGSLWQDAVAADAPAGTPASWLEFPSRVIRWEPLQRGWPRPWVVLTSRPGALADKFVEAAREFLAAASASLGTPRDGRAVPLLALPVVGAGMAGGAYMAGSIVRALLPALYEFTQASQIDVALVMKDPSQYAAAQAVRSEVKGDAAWPELDERLRAKVDDLAERAFRRELVLFLGAGVSQSAGLPSWNGLLRHLAGSELADNPDFQRLGGLDQARVVQQRLPANGNLGKAVAGRIRADHYSLAHGLLAALPVQEVVTTNYDTLFEVASKAIGRPVDVLPYQLTGGRRRWLLKLHGCVSRPEDIVLTREDYLRYDAGRAALAGLVQGLLITRHMLFVGFSLGDDNFHRIADAVRRAVQREPFGTSLSVAGNRLLQEVWARDLDWIELGDLPGSARLLEIVLDRLASRTVSTADHLFDSRYRTTLSQAEVSLGNELTRLAAFVASVPQADRRGAAWVEIEGLLRGLGLAAGVGTGMKKTGEPEEIDRLAATGSLETGPGPAHFFKPLTEEEVRRFLADLAASGLVRVVRFSGEAAAAGDDEPGLELHILGDNNLPAVTEIFHRHGVRWDSSNMNAVGTPPDGGQLPFQVRCSHFLLPENKETFPLAVCGVEFLAYRQSSWR